MWEENFGGGVVIKKAIEFLLLRNREGIERRQRLFNCSFEVRQTKRKETQIVRLKEEYQGKEKRKSYPILTNNLSTFVHDRTERRSFI